MQTGKVKLNVTHNKRSMKAMELRFDCEQTVASVKVGFT